MNDDMRVGDKVKIKESGGTWGEVVSISKLGALVNFKKGKHRMEMPFRYHQLFNVSAQARKRARNKSGKFSTIDHKMLVKISTGCWADPAYEHDWKIVTYTEHFMYFKCESCGAGLTRPRFEYDPDAEKLLNDKHS